MDDKTRLELYQVMVLSRTYEEAILREYHADKKPAFDIGAGLVPGEMHLSAGQEPAAAGVCAHLRRDDAVTATHRPHHIAIAHGVDLDKMTAEIFGRETGLGRGRGGHMHLFDPQTHFSCSGIVAEGLPPATGQAFAFQRQGSDRVAVAFTGEGAANQGAFHESLNLAALWNLPVVFVIEDNEWAISVSREASTAIGSNADRAAAYGIPGQRIEDNDVEAVYTAAGDAVARARAGEGPTLIEVHTVRLWGHFEGMRRDTAPIWPMYRTAIRSWRTRRYLPMPGSSAPTWPPASRTRRWPGWRRPSTSPNPARCPRRRRRLSTCSREGSTQMSVTESASAPAGPAVRRLTTARAMVEGIAQEMERDASVVVLGEDVAKYGGIFSSTAGLLDKFGPRRVIDTPISETAFIGLGIGAAIEGMRPVVELMFVDFFGVCMDQIYNHMAKIHFESGGNVRVPMVLMTATGGGYSDAEQHSQCLWGTFAHLPGMKVVVPSNPADAKGLMISAIRDDNPVVYMFHKGIMGLPWMAKNARSIAAVPAEPYETPIGKASIAREGSDATVVTVSLSVHHALDVADQMSAEHGVELEVIDLRSLVPLDREAVLESVAKTGRLLVVDEDYQSFGLSGEIAATVAETDPGMLRAPVRRVAVPDVPIPYARSLESAVLPTRERIMTAARELVRA